MFDHRIGFRRYHYFRPCEICNAPPPISLCLKLKTKCWWACSCYGTEGIFLEETQELHIHRRTYISGESSHQKSPGPFRKIIATSSSKRLAFESTRHPTNFPLIEILQPSSTSEARMNETPQEILHELQQSNAHRIVIEMTSESTARQDTPSPSPSPPQPASSQQPHVPFNTMEALHALVALSS
jgi:hypothetical protein